VLLIANRASRQDGDRGRAMDDVRTLLLGAMAARGRVLVKLNVSEERLKDVLQVLPAMKAPTVSPLAEEGAYAVETVVDKASVNTLLPLLKAHGATDILELPIRKIVP
jgi:ATP phosphoribosyltransferase